MAVPDEEVPRSLGYTISLKSRNRIRSLTTLRQNWHACIPRPQGGRVFCGIHYKDAGDEIPAAVVVATSPIEGRIGNDDRDDYLRIPASLGRKISVTVIGDGLIDVQLYNQERNYAEQAKSIIAGSPASLNAPEGDGDYYLQITNVDSAVNYRIEIQP